MNRLLTLALSLGALTAASAAEPADTIVLNLAQATTPLTFDTENGMWDDTYTDDETVIESQCFSFVHGAMGSWQTWWGFTASNSTDNQRQTNTIKYQFSNMAKGGIALTDDGRVKLDEFGAPVTDAAMPYLVAYYSPYMSRRPVDMTFNTDKSYEAIGVYVNLNSYPYYCIEYGDSYARAFNNGDRFTLTIHGVAPDESEKSIDVDLASYTNGNLTINRGWSYVDLTELGTINELYFTMSTTDVGDYGDNTPAYFCMDKLIVREVSGSSIESIAPAAATTITYDRSTRQVNVGDAEFAAVYDVYGNLQQTSTSSSFSISSLPAGIYLIRAANATLKVAR